MHYQHCTCLPTDIQMWWCTLYHFQCVDSVHKHAKSISGLQKGSTVVATFKALHCLLSPDCGMIQDETESPSRLEASAAPVQALPTAANSPYNQQSMSDTAPNSISCTCKRKQAHTSSTERPRKMLKLLDSATKTDLHVTRSKAKAPVHRTAGAVGTCGPTLTQDHSQ